MRILELSRGKNTLIDDEDYDYLNKWKWCCHSSGYAIRTQYLSGKKHKTIWMHRILMNTSIGMHTDHINGNKLDNRRCNLRICTPSQNGANRKIQKASSVFKGVSWNKKIRLWKAAIKVSGKQYYLGWFKNEKEAALAYNNAARKFFGEFSYLNKV